MKTVKQLLQGKTKALCTISPDTRVFEALKQMAEKDIGALLVVENGRLAGILSERDYARKVILQGKSSHDTPVNVSKSSSATSMACSQRTRWKNAWR